MAKLKGKKLKAQIEEQPKQNTFNSNSKSFLFGFLLFSITLISYYPAWNGHPVWDDEGHITKLELRSFSGLHRIWTELGATQQYYPLVHTAFWVQQQLWGGTLLGYHLVNILLHILSALLLIRIFIFLRIPGAWLAGALWALHPIQVESVAWITELKNVLSGVFFFSAGLLYLKFDRDRRKTSYIAALFLFLLGLLSKSVVAMLPVALIAIIWLQRGVISWKRDVVTLVPFFALGITAGLFTAWVERRFIGAEGGEFDFSIIERFLIAGRVVWFYLGKLSWPTELIFIYPRWNVNQAIWWQYLFPAATALLTAVLWIFRKKSRAPLAAFVYFCAMLFPVMGFFNVFPFKFSFVADHFQYLACIGPLVIMVAGGGHIVKYGYKTARTLVTMFILCVLSSLTWRQCSMYADSETLYRTTIKKNPSCWMAYGNLGMLLAESGRSQDAMPLFQKAIRENPRYSEAYYNLGLLLWKTGHTEKALTYYKMALDIKPSYPEANNNLGFILAGIGKTDEAMSYYKRALSLKPDFPEAWNNLGNAYLQLSDPDNAIKLFRKAIQYKPAYAEAYYNIAVIFAQSGAIDSAVFYYYKTLEFNPNDAEACNNLGIILSDQGKVVQAEDFYRKAIRINPYFIEAHNNLGLLMSKRGKTNEAIAHYQQALNLSPDNISILQNFADAFYQTNRFEEAVQYLERALSIAMSAGNTAQEKAISMQIKKIKRHR